MEVDCRRSHRVHLLGSTADIGILTCISELCPCRSEDIVFMLNANLFRALPPSKGGDQENYDPDEEEPSLEPTWPHLQVSAGSCARHRLG